MTTAAAPFWHECMCPDVDPYADLGRMDVSYCPSHGILVRIVDQLGEPRACGCVECYDREQEERDRRRISYVMSGRGYFFDLPDQSAQEWIDGEKATRS